MPNCFNSTVSARTFYALHHSMDLSPGTKKGLVVLADGTKVSAAQLSALIARAIAAVTGQGERSVVFLRNNNRLLI